VFVTPGTVVEFTITVRVLARERHVTRAVYVSVIGGWQCNVEALTEANDGA
jgi:hypothetical protein